MLVREHACKAAATFRKEASILIGGYTLAGRLLWVSYYIFPIKIWWGNMWKWAVNKHAYERRRDDMSKKKKTRNPARKTRGGGRVSQKIRVSAHAALSVSDHDNLTAAVCFSARDSSLWVTLAAPIGGWSKTPERKCLRLSVVAAVWKHTSTGFDPLRSCVCYRMCCWWALISLF